jgi:hypothetical protein
MPQDYNNIKNIPDSLNRGQFKFWTL